MTTLVSWNINSLDKRIDLIEEIILNHKPDIFMIQEIRSNSNWNTVDERFDKLGYNAIINHPKDGRAGVGIILQKKFKYTEKNIFFKNSCGRYQEVDLDSLGGVRLINVYVPQGSGYKKGEIHTDIRNQDFPLEYFYKKIDFLRELCVRLYRCVVSGSRFILCGDLNVVLKEYDSWHKSHGQSTRGRVSFTGVERSLVKCMLSLGQDAFESKIGSDRYTWYDYRKASYGTEKDNMKRGMKIDYIIFSKSFKVVNFDSWRMINYRFGIAGKTSDHVPLITSLK